MRFSSAKMASFSALVFAAVSLAFFVATPAAASTKEEAAAYVEALGNKVVSIIGNKTLSKEKKKTQIERIFSENVDIPWVGRFVVGRFWRQTSDEQKAKYLKEYENFLITHYASRFSEYSNGTFKIIGTQMDGESEFTVSMEIASADKDAKPILADYRVHREGGKGFKVFDVIIEGVSMITTQRAEFNAVLNAKGMDALIESLANKTIAPAPLDK